MQGSATNANVAIHDQRLLNLLFMGLRRGSVTALGFRSLARRAPRLMMRGLAPWFMYVARCADGTLYTGVALDVCARIAAHDAGRGARYTRGRGPLELLATRRCATKGNALRLELAFKRLARDEKLAVVASPRKLAALARRTLAAARLTAS